MRVTLYPDLEIENWKSMNLYAEKLYAHLSLLLPGDDIRYLKMNGSDLSKNRFCSRYFVYPRLVKKVQGEINHILDHSYAHLISRLDPKRTVITVHDLYPLYVIAASKIRLRDQVRKFVLGWVMSHCLRAAWLIANSEFTKNEILKFTDYPSERISVINLGVDSSFFDPVSEEEKIRFKADLNLSDKLIILHVGECKPRKNIPMLLYLLKNLSQQFSNKIHLLQVGGRFTPEQRALVDQLNLRSSITQIHEVSEKSLILAYRIATLLIFPSTYEGFGLPPLEAMAAGTPVLATKTGALGEVIGDAGILVDPEDLEAYTNSAMDILNRPELRASLARKGKGRASEFSWLKTASETLNIYKRIYAEIVQ